MVGDDLHLDWGGLVKLIMVRKVIGMSQLELGEDFEHWEGCGEGFGGQGSGYFLPLLRPVSNCCKRTLGILHLFNIEI